MKRKALGKGLAALLPEAPPEAESGETTALLEVPLSRLDPNPDQPRQHIDDQKLEELARSMREQGLVQPLVVRKQGARFQIIAGERRFRAAKQAGLDSLPVIVREASDAELLEVALVENIQREELNPIEEAAAYRRLVSELGYSQEQVARRVGKDRSTIANLLRLLRLPREVRELIASDALSPGHARPLLSLSSAESQIEIAKQVVDKGLSAREVERRVKSVQSKSKRKSREAKRNDPNTRDAEARMERALGTTVRIRRRGQKGQVEIDFHSEEELDRIFGVVLRGGRGSSRKTTPTRAKRANGKGKGDR